MLMPSIFGEDLFEDLFDLPFYDDSKVEKKLYGRHAKNLMKTDIKEMDNGYCERSFYVGEDITEEDIKGEFKHGILKLFVPKKEAKAAVPERKFIAIEG